MAGNSLSTAELYVIALRIIQPARVQDVISACGEIWGIELTDELKSGVMAVHEKMRADGYLISVRKGTFVLDARGTAIAARLATERALDNARMFLMKKQRKQYHRLAGRHG